MDFSNHYSQISSTVSGTRRINGKQGDIDGWEVKSRKGIDREIADKVHGERLISTFPHPPPHSIPLLVITLADIS